jgi:hypothetical protein
MSTRKIRGGAKIETKELNNKMILPSISGGSQRPDYFETASDLLNLVLPEVVNRISDPRGMFTRYYDEKREEVIVHWVWSKQYLKFVGDTSYFFYTENDTKFTDEKLKHFIENIDNAIHDTQYFLNYINPTYSKAGEVQHTLVAIIKVFSIVRKIISDQLPQDQLPQSQGGSRKKRSVRRATNRRKRRNH